MHLSYQLIHADIVIRDTPYTTWLCASQDFKQPGESKIAFDAYYEVEHTSGESSLDFCERNGWAEFIDQMLNGVLRKIDLKPFWERDRKFQPLLHRAGLFGLVQIQTEGYGITWGEDLDIADAALY